MHTVDKALDLLDSVLSGFSKAFVIIDALDECQIPSQSRRRLLEELFTFQQKHSLGLFATCRDNRPDIAGIFQGKPNLKIEAHTEDVESSLSGRIGILPNYVQRRADLQKEIISNDRLDDAYADAPYRIKSQLDDQVQSAKDVLSWFSCATRPSSTLQLRNALATEDDQLSLDDEETIPDIDDLVSVCAGLVTVDEQSQVVRLVHFTTQEYFDRNQARPFS